MFGLTKDREMTDSLSDVSAGDSSSSLRDVPYGAAHELPGESQHPDVSQPLPASQDSHPSQASVGSRNDAGLDISPDELTVITQTQDLADSQANISSLEGRLIGNFELKQFLGGGGMGIVFRAFDSVLSRSVAIKLLPRAGTKTETIQRFQVEARSAARLDHPNISRVFQVGSDNACDYIIFEFVEGDNLSQLVRRIGPLPYDLALRYTFQLALAIQHAYQRGVVHRDIKPANVVVTDGGKLKLIDLGLARAPKSNENDNSLTATGVMLGTYDYLSPEQAKDSRSADVRSDLYSLGCTVFFMLTGQPPYPQGTPIEKIIQHSSEKRPRPSDYRADLPPGFDAMTSKLLAINPDDRFQRPAELIAEIQELATRNNIPLLGYDDNVVVKKIITRPSWTMQLVPVLIPIVLLIGFVFYLDWADRNSREQRANRSNDPGVVARPSEDLLQGKEAEGQGGNQKQPSNSEKSKTVDDGKKPTPKKSSAGVETPANKKSKVVGDGKTQLPGQTTLVTVGAPEGLDGSVEDFEDLESALEAVGNDPRLNEIRIYRDSLLLSRPVSIKVNRTLRITSAGDSETMILFRPDEPYRSAYFRVRGGNIEFRNVHFRLETNSDLQPNTVSGSTAAPVTFFDLEAVTSTSFSGCSITIDNFDDDGQKILPRARFFALAPPRRNKAMFDIQPGEITVSKPSVALRNCCIRGEADVFHFEESFPVTVSLINGLCVTDGRVFDFGPERENQVIGQKEIEIYLTKFTSISSLGFAQVDSGTNSVPVPLRLVAKQSIFNYGSENSFIVHRNLADDTQRSRMLILKCQDSFFPQKNPLWTLSYRSRPDESDVLDFNAMGDWLDVTGTAGDTGEVTWQNFEGLTIPPSEHTVFDYRLSGPFEKNPAIRREAGLDTQGFTPIPPAFIE